MSKLTIHSDGTGAQGTVVLDEEGRQIENITRISVDIEARGVVEATLEFVRPSVMIHTDTITSSWQCPGCDEPVDHDCGSQFRSPTQRDSFASGSRHLLGDSQKDSCGHHIRLVDPHSEHTCIREKGHSLRHFDGSYVWG